MSDPAAVANAQRKLAQAGRTFMGMSFKAIADVLKSVAGPSFDDRMFAAHVGNIQLNRIGATNEAGDTDNSFIRVVTGGVFNDNTFQIAAPSDRFRVILGLKMTLVTATPGDDTLGGVGVSNVPEPVIQQLIAGGNVRLDRSRGRMVQSRWWQFLTGADNFRVNAAAGNGALPRIPSEQEILPHGIASSLWTALDAINPKDRLNITMAGLAGQPAAAGFTDDLLVGIDALVFDAVMSGQ